MFKYGLRVVEYLYIQIQENAYANMSIHMYIAAIKRTANISGFTSHFRLYADFKLC